MPTPTPAVADKTFYVVAYHWGWAAFGENGTHLDQIRVKEGTVLEIYAVNYLAHDAIGKLPPSVAEAIKQVRAPGEEAILGAFQPLYAGGHPENHGFAIPEHGVVERLYHDAKDPVRVVITAKRGTFEFVCIEYCGPGHNGMHKDMLVVDGMSEESQPLAEVNLGQQLFNSKGCAACHGSHAQGGAIAPRIAGANPQLIRTTVRSGRNVMPAFAEGVLSEEGLAAIIAYLQSLAAPRP